MAPSYVVSTLSSGDTTIVNYPVSFSFFPPHSSLPAFGHFTVH